MWNERISAVIFKSDDYQTIQRVHKMLELPYYPVKTVELNSNHAPDYQHLADILDSLYNLTETNNSYRILIASRSSDERKDILTILDKHDYDTARFILTPSETQSLQVQMVSVAKKDLNRSDNNNSIVNLHVSSGLFEKGDNEIIDLIDWKPGIHDLSLETDEYVVYVDRLVPPEYKKLSEVRGAVISDYQNYLEKVWVKELKGKYNVNINNNVLKEIYRKFEAH
jgi:peptidyl-prolyl cis-trans isomerase SurA